MRNESSSKRRASITAARSEAPYLDPEIDPGVVPISVELSISTALHVPPVPVAESSRLDFYTGCPPPPVSDPQAASTLTTRSSTFKMQESPLLIAGIVPMFTVSHAVLPVFFFRAFLDGLAHFRSIMRPDAAGRMFRVYARVFRVVVCLGIGVWFAVPAIALAYLTGWLSLAWAASHVLLARRETRAWTFITYGSSSMALLLLVVCFSAEGFFPLGIVVVVLQALLLTILDRFARHKWTSEGVR